MSATMKPWFDTEMGGRRLPIDQALSEANTFVAALQRQWDAPNEVAEVWFGENAVPQALVIEDGVTLHCAWDGNDWVVERSW